jgi:5-methylcytosine-specific restriction endonuclease McrA
VSRECPHCHSVKPFTDFQFTKHGSFSGWCRKCRSDKEEQRRRAKGMKKAKRSVIVDGKKSCMHCLQMKPLSEFYPSIRGKGGVSAYCAKCSKLRFYNPEKARENTARYRQRNRDWHLCLHRLRMYERKTRQRVTDDGTVTREFTQFLYSVEHCAYCFRFVTRSERTADHRISLARGGVHSASNLVMACWHCNSSKRDLDENEFRALQYARSEVISNYVAYFIPH